MEINVNVDNIDLNTVVGKKVRSYQDGDGDYEEGPEDDLTLGDVVVKAIITKAMRGSYPSVEELVKRIRAEQVAEATAAQVKLAIEKPYRKTNRYGEAQSGETTLTELMFEHVEKVLTTYGKDGYNNRGDQKKDALWNLIVTVVTGNMQKEWQKRVEETVDRAAKVVVEAGEKKIQERLTELDTIMQDLRDKVLRARAEINIKTGR